MATAKGPVDVAGSDVSRLSRSSRTRAPALRKPSATVTPRDFARPQLALQPATVSPGAALAEGLADFFGTATEIAIKKDAEEQKRKDRDESLSVIAKVNADRAGARAALARGETGEFVTPGMEQRQAVVNAFEQAVAEASAEDDFNDEFKGVLANLSPTDDPQAALEAYLKTKIKGGSGTYKGAYTDAMLKRTSPAIKDFRTTRMKLAVKRAEQAATASVDRDISSKAIPVTPDGHIAALAKVTAMMPHASQAERVLAAEAVFEDAIIRAAPIHDHALKLMNMRKAGYRDGTSIADRNPGAFDKAFAANMKKFDTQYSMPAQRTYADIDRRLTAVAAGQPENPGDTAASLYAEVAHAGKVWGTTSKDYIALHRRAAKARNGTANTNNALNVAAMGGTPNLSHADHAKVAPSYLDPNVHEAIGKKLGVDPRIVAQRMMKIYSVRGVGKKAAEGNTGVLMTSQNNEQVKSLFDQLSRVRANRNVKMDDKDTMHLTPEGNAMFSFMLARQQSGEDPLTARAKYLENMRKSGGALKVFNHYSKRVNEKGEANGPEALESAAKEAWDQLDLPGAEDYDELADHVKAQLRLAVNTGSAFGQQTEDEVAKYAAIHLKNSFSMERRPNGDRRYTLDNTPALVVGADGKLQRGVKLDEATLERIDDSMTSEENRGIQGFFGPVGQKVDNKTAAGYGLLATAEVGGVEAGIRIAPGKRFRIPLDQFPKDFSSALGGFADVKVENDTVIFSIPPVPQEGFQSELGDTTTKADGTVVTTLEAFNFPGDHNEFPLTSNFFMMYDVAQGVWEMRYKESGARRTDIRALSEKHLTAHQKLFKARPTTSAGRAKATIKGIGPNADDLHRDATSEVPTDSEPAPPNPLNRGATTGRDTSPRPKPLSERFRPAPRSEPPSDDGLF